MKINDSFAFNTAKMLVILKIGIKTLGLTGSLDYSGQAHFGQGQQRAVDGIQGDIGVVGPEPAKESFGTRVIFGLQQGLENRQTLRRDLKTPLAALFLEIVYTVLLVC